MFTIMIILSYFICNPADCVLITAMILDTVLGLALLLRYAPWRIIYDNNSNNDI